MRKSNLLYLCVVCSILVKANVATVVGFTATFRSEGQQDDIGGYETITFESVTSNVGSGYDAATGIFKAPVAGLYVFNVETVVGPEKLAVPALLNINQDTEPGTGPVVRGYVLVDNSKVDQFSTGSKTVVLNLGAHDKVWVQNQLSITLKLHGFSSFSGYLLGPVNA